MSIAYIGIGANKGNIGETLRSARSALHTLGAVRFSREFASAPLHVHDQPTYTNQVAELCVRIAPSQLLRNLFQIETEFGRNRASERRFGERTLDLDLLLYDNLIMRSEFLVLPHARMHTRAFVLQPLLELLPDGKHPVTQIPWWQYAKRCAHQDIQPLTAK